MDLIQTYHDLIEAIVYLSGESHNSMHVHAGLALFLMAQLAIRTRRGSVRALQLVFFVAILHETAERLYYGSWRWSDTLSDLVVTMMWPTLIVMVSLYRRKQWEMRYKQHMKFARLMSAPAKAEGA